MKSVSRKLILGAVVMGVLSTSAMAWYDRGMYGGVGVGDTPAQAKKDARQSSEMDCKTHGGVMSFHAYRAKKVSNGSWEVEYKGKCNDY
jgi:hypothetical protein